MRQTLRFKLTFVICGVLLVAMALFAALTIQGLRNLLLTEKVAHTDSLSETLMRTTNAQMMSDNHEQVYRIFSDARVQEGIEKIRLINKFGIITYSTDAMEIGTRLDKSAESCTMCHAGESPLVHASSMNRSRIFTGRDGAPLLGLARAIYNEPACYNASCHVHPPQHKILGVIDIVVSLRQMHETLNSYGERFILHTLALLILIAVALTVFTQKLVNRPVQQLLRQTYLVAAGQLDASLPQVVDDELGELASAFNRMTRSLQQARMELEDWNRTLEARVRDRTEELNRMQAQLLRSEKLASLGELVAGIAHEINNPLTGILMFSNLVQNSPRLAPELQEDLHTIIHETERCAKIVRGLLDFSRRTVPEKSWSSLNEILRRAVALVENMPFFHGVRIERDYLPNLPELLVDPGQVEQVLVNIILNAGQAMAGSGTLAISTGLASDGTWVYVRIADTGCGIPREHLGKIFDPFFSTKEHLGTGLGLSVSYGIIENHGGNIEVQSEVGQGTTFTVELPLIQDRAGAVEALHLDLNGKE